MFILQPHEDGPLFYPTVSTISLGSHTLLDFYHHIDNTEQDDNDNVSKGGMKPSIKLRTIISFLEGLLS